MFDLKTTTNVAMFLEHAQKKSYLVHAPKIPPPDEDSTTPVSSVKLSESSELIELCTIAGVKPTCCFCG